MQTSVLQTEVMITNGQRLINRLLRKKFRTSTIFAYLAGERSDAVMDEFSRVDIDLTNHSNDHVKMVFKNYLACVLGGYEAWPCARLLRLLIGINSEPELLFYEPKLLPKVAKELAKRIIATPDQFSEAWMVPLIHSECPIMKDARNTWYHYHNRRRLVSEDHLTYPEDLTVSCLTPQEEQFHQETRMNQEIPTYFPVQRKLFFKGRLFTHTEDEHVGRFVRRVSDSYHLTRPGANSKVEDVVGDIVQFIKDRVTWHATVKELAPMDGYRVFEIYQPHYYGGQHWNLFYAEDTQKVVRYAHFYFSERFALPYKEHSISAIHKLSGERCDYHAHTPEFMSVNWEEALPKLVAHKEEKRTKGREKSASVRESRDQKKEREYESQRQEKADFGLYGVLTKEIDIREVEICLFWAWGHSDVEGEVKKICRRLAMFYFTSESRSQESTEVGGDGKATNEAVRLSTLTRISESYPDSQVLVMRTTKDGFVEHEFGDSSQVHVYFAVRSPDYGLDAWVSPGAPMYPGVEGRALGILFRSVGWYEEYTMKRFFPCLDWRQWTVFYLSASCLKSMKGVLWFSVLGDGFSWHVPFSFETHPQIEPVETQMSRLWFDGETWVLTEKIAGESRSWPQLPFPHGSKRRSEGEGPPKKRRRQKAST